MEIDEEVSSIHEYNNELSRNYRQVTTFSSVLNSRPTNPSKMMPLDPCNCPQDPPTPHQ